MWREASEGIRPGHPDMQANIGQLTLENDFLEKEFTEAGMLSAKR